MKHLIITTAIVPEEICFQKLGYSYEQRSADYIKSFEHGLLFKDNFNSITIIEMISNEKIDILENSGINVYYSKFDNLFVNKGINEIFHIIDFFKNSNIKDDDLIIKITGRYLMMNDNILKIDSDFIAKYDGDIYSPLNRGIHTFFFAFKKKLFIEFFNSLDFVNNNYDNICIEWLLKDFMIQKNIPILDKNYKLGVITCLYNKEIDKWTRVLT